MRWRFRPPPWSIVATLLAMAVMITAGVWQCRRAVEKQALQSQFAKAATEAPSALSAATAAGSLHAVAVIARGRYLGERQMLLDNQVLAQRPGFHVWTPLRLDDGTLVIVNRGWIVQGPNRRVAPPLPVPDDEVEVRGLWRKLPEPGLRLGGDGCAAEPTDGGWPRIVEYPTADMLACLLGRRPLSGELLLAADAPDGFVREWMVGDNGFPPARHYAYAAQWFAFAATLLVLFVKLNLKPNRKSVPS